MASLDGLPPLPKSLSGVNLIDYHSFQSGSSGYSLPPEKNSGLENNSSKTYLLNSENGNFFSTPLRNYSGSSLISSDTAILGRNRSAAPSRDVTSNLGFKQLSDPSSVGSARASPVVSSSRTTPLSSARASPIGNRSTNSPVPAYRGSTPPGMRGLPPPPPPPRQHHSNVHNGFEKSATRQPPRSGRIFNLDTQLASLRKEMFSLRQMDLSLLNQLWSLNEAMQEFRQVQEENSAFSPPSPPSCDESDEFYSPLSSRGFQNISGMQITSFSAQFNTSGSSSDASVEFGDV